MTKQMRGGSMKHPLISNSKPNSKANTRRNAVNQMWIVDEEEDLEELHVTGQP
jgi:hypothetical protein